MLAGVALGFCRWRKPNPSAADIVKVRFQRDLVPLDSAVARLLRSAEGGAQPTRLQAEFRAARLAYKQVEWLADYYFPETAKSLNGPAIPEFEAEDSKTLAPEGFQVVEEFLFPTCDPATRAELVQALKLLHSNVGRLRTVSETLVLTDAHVFDAARLEVVRVITLGVTGFDSPAALHSLPEGKVALRSLRENLTGYETRLRKANPALASHMATLFQKAEIALTGPFNTFDRLRFLTNVANPLSATLLDAQRTLGIQPFTESRGLRANARSPFEAGAFDPEHYLALTEYRTTPARVALGQRLFQDPVLSGNGQRSCASCHQPARAFTDGQPTSAPLTGGAQRRNAPTLLNVALQRGLFYDARVAYLEDQATDVIGNRAEMHGSLARAVATLRQQPAYADSFRRAYRDGVSDLNIRNALAAYERSLVRLDSRFDRYLRGNRRALNDVEKHGFNLFAGKARCATCHFLPLTNGLVPPFFEKSESEVLGVPTNPNWNQARLDPDLGRFNATKAEIHRHAFKTPTVRNVARTAPYMHNGAFKTLEEVVEFYNRGGGRGLGFDLLNQTLPEDRLNLSENEKKALVAFLNALTDEN